MGFFDPFGGSGGIIVPDGSGGTIVPGNYATKAELNFEAEKRASDDKELQNEIKANTESISNLVAETESVNQSVSGLEKSVEELQENKANAADVYNKDETDNKITEKVAEIVSGAPEEFDTLKEMSDWLTEHEDSAATMNSAILKNKEDIAENTEAIEQNKADILSAKNNIAVNRTTLGYQGKNLLNHTAKTETVNGVNITVNADGSITFAGTFNGTSAYYHQLYRNADGSNKTIGKGKYIVSGGVEEFGFFVKHGTNFSGNNGTQFSVKTSDVPITIENETEYIDFFVPLSPSREYNATIYPMLRPADITDDTYEPYKPSVNKRLIEVEQNKMGYDYGYAYAPNASSTGWFKLASFKCANESASIAIATFYITGINSEQNGLLTVSMLANTGVGNGISSLGCSWAYVGTNYKGIITIKPADFKAVANVNGGYIDIELWCGVTVPYGGYKARVMNFEGRSNFYEVNSNVMLYRSNTGLEKSTELNNPDNTTLSREKESIYGLSVLLNDFETRLKALETAQTTAE